MSIEDNKFDTRLLERRFNAGLMTREEYQKHLEALPDMADEADKVEIEFERSDEQTDEDE